MSINLRKRPLPSNLEEDTSINQNNLDLNYYFKEIDKDIEKNDKFKTTRYKVSYSFENFEKVPDPMYAIRDCFDLTIKKALQNAKEKQFDPDRIGVVISSPNLDPPINIPINPVNENTLFSIFNRFWIVQQSKTKEQSLIGEAFKMEITLVTEKLFQLYKKLLVKEKRLKIQNIILIILS